MVRVRSRDLVSRRETLRALGGAGFTALLGWNGGRIAGLLRPSLGESAGGGRAYTADASSLGCIVRPQETEGPYFVDEKLNRSDVRTDPMTGTAKPGLPLQLTFNVGRINGSACEALSRAHIDIWHCDALGVYSDVTDPSFNTTGQRFLRGYQVTDSSGSAKFTTIYPGWYSGRAVHIHFKIRLFAGSPKTYEFTSQLYFDDSVTDQVHAQAPYNAKGRRNTRNSQDGIYRNGGSRLLLDLASTRQGYSAVFDIGLAGITSRT